MLLSRGLTALRMAKLINPSKIQTLQPVRNSHYWFYRTVGAQPSKYINYIAEGVQGFAWWWVMWHLWTEPNHILGEFEYPDPRKWTNEELGIPSD